MVSKTCDIKRISQIFWGFKSNDMLEQSAILEVYFYCRYMAGYLQPKLFLNLLKIWDDLLCV